MYKQTPEPTVISAGILPLLLRRKRLLLVSGVVTACLAFAVSRVLPVPYASEGVLSIDQRPTAGTSESQTVLTETEVLKSSGLIRLAVIDYKLDEAPDLIPRYRLPEPIDTLLVQARDELLGYWRSLTNNTKKPSNLDNVIEYIRTHVQVIGKEKSFVISISFEAGSPETAALVSNAIIGEYLKGIESAKTDRITQADQMIGEQITSARLQVGDAERAVNGYVKTHVLPQMQGSLTTVMQLSRDESQLAQAREDLARKEAALSTVNRGSVAGSMEALDNKTLQALKENETKVVTQLGVLSSYDPRREPLDRQLASIRGQIAAEKSLIFQALGRDVQITRARVTALETAIDKERATAQGTSVADTTLKQLISDLDAKRQLFVGLVADAGRSRIAALQAPTAHQLFRALPPDRPAHSFGMLSIILGMMLGLIGSSISVMMRAMLGSTVYTAEEMAMIGLPVVGSLPRLSKSELTKTALQSAPQVSETFRSMWLTMRPQNGKGAIILVTSGEMGEGKTTIALALAQRFADDEFRVLLIDADLRHPRLSSMFRQSSGSHAHLQSVINGETTLERAIVTIQPRLDCLLTSGSTNPTKLLASKRFEDILGEMSSRYDFVILDSAPALHVTDPVFLAHLCQHIILVVQSGRLTNELVSETIRRFPEEERHKIVTLMNRVARKKLQRRDYYSGYVNA